MKKGSVGHAFLFLALAVLISSPFVFAGLSDWWNSMTGKATSDQSDVYVSVGNTAPTVTRVINSSMGSVNPTAGTTTTVTFLFNASDADGVANLDDATAQANISLGSTDRINNSCKHITDYASFNTAMYHCTVRLFYYDLNSTKWVVNASITDINGAYASNTTRRLTYNLLHDTNFSDSDGAALNLTFPGLSTSSVNQSSLNDPLTVFNRGNANGLKINVTGVNLAGQTTPSEFIYAANFSVGLSETTDCTPSGMKLINGTSRNVTGALLNRGQGATEQIFFCIDAINPSLSSQIYNTTGAGGGAWTIETNYYP